MKIMLSSANLKPEVEQYTGKVHFLAHGYFIGKMFNTNTKQDKNPPGTDFLGTVFLFTNYNPDILFLKS